MMQAAKAQGLAADATAASGHIELASADAAAPWGSALQAAAEQAWQETARRLGLEPPARVRLVSFGSLFELERYLGSRPTHVVALARTGGGLRPEVLVLRPAWSTLDAFEQAQVLVHEMTHLVVATRFVGPIPVWLNEGLAMLTAGELRMGDSVRLVVAGTFGNVLPLRQIESNLLVGGETQALAYAQSLSLTRFLLRRDFSNHPQGATPRALATVLADPEYGPRLLARLDDANYRTALDQQWRASQQTLWSWIGVLSGGGFIWGVTTVLFLLAGWRKRRFARQLRERMASEEALNAEFGGTGDWEDARPWEAGADTPGELPAEPNEPAGNAGEPWSGEDDDDSAAPVRR